MTIKGFIKRERKNNRILADLLERHLDTLKNWNFYDSQLKAAYEIRGILFGLLYGNYITADEFESLMDDWAVITKDI